MKENVSAPTHREAMTFVEVVAVILYILGALVALAGYPFGLFGSLFAGLAILVAETRDALPEERRTF